MRRFLAGYRLPILFGVLVILALVSIVRDREVEHKHEQSSAAHLLFDLVIPLQGVLTKPVRAVADIWDDYVALVGIKEENDRLKRELAEVKDHSLQYREALVASSNLHRLVEMRRGFEAPLLPAAVVGHSLSPWFRSVLIERGTGSDVRSGMSVLGDGGLVGLVTASSAHASRAMLLLDRQSAVAGMVQRSRARGIVRGLGSGKLEFALMVRDDDIVNGDLIVTSGLDGIHPKALQIGMVVSVHQDQDTLVHVAMLKPSVDFGRLEQVFVLKRRGPTMQFLYENEENLSDRKPDKSQP